MRTQNIECQLAQGQLNRYLAGEAFSETAIRQLEDHVNECPACTLLIAQRKQALLAETGGMRSTTAAVQLDEPDANAEAAIPRFLSAAIRAKRTINHTSETSVSSQSAASEAVRRASTKTNSNAVVISDNREPELSKSAYIRPLIYSIALGAVLIGMSSIMRDPTKLFGQRAATVLPAGETSTGGSSPKAFAESSKEQVPDSKTKEVAGTLDGTDSDKTRETRNGNETDPMARPDETAKVAEADSKMQQRANLARNDATQDQKKPAPTREVAATIRKPKSSTPRRKSSPRSTSRRPVVASKRQVPKRRTMSVRRPVVKRPANRVQIVPEAPNMSPKPGSNSGVVIYDDAGKPVNKP